ncbi:MAG TPA: S9 family peptidase, partial [Cryomorphaceae bacterium]|nr:S9 family peptidase [Cryomorphaceae bacterium]
PTLETLHTSDGNQLRVIQDNTDLKARLRSYNLASKEFFTFTTEDQVELNGWIMKPFDFDPAKKYPVLMFVYGGPGSQTVKNQYDGFNHFYYETLANQGYLIVSVDNRGTGARGRDFRTTTYQELGKFETEDQISGAKYLGTLPYVDKDRIGIWGWSYGGYMSSLCITKGADVFKMAVAVAPVTNWRFYDSIYTERYMRTPQDNASGYDENSPINHVSKLKGAYLLIHGTADDNVHFQNTTRMISALVDANKQFDLFVYPDKNHGIYGGYTRYHLFKKMTNFINENL